MNTLTPLSKAILLMVISALCLALLNFTYKESMLYLAISYAALLRMVLPLLVLLPVAYRQQCSLRPYWRWHCLRGLFVAAYMWCLFLCVKYSSILDATLLFSTGPLLMPFLSRMFLKNPLRRQVLVSCAIGFVGVAFAIKPDHGILKWSALFGLLAGVGNALSQLCLHRTAQKQSPLENMFAVYLWSSCFFVPPFLYTVFVQHITFHWSGHLVWIFVLVVALSFFNQVIRGITYRLVKNPATVLPILYLSIPFSGLLDWLAYHQLPSWNKIVGAAIVMVSVVVISILKPKSSLTKRKAT